MHRDSYSPKSTSKYSTQNEPPKNLWITANARQYPDMYKVYTHFKQLIGVDNVILTSGAEMALRIALLLTKPRLLSIESPSWTMPQVAAYALDIPYELFSIRKQGASFVHDYETIHGDVVYITDEYNNVIKHECFDINKLPTTIVDTTYSLNKELYTVTEPNIFYIGSFSKIAGCGLRLGYLVYPHQYEERAQLLREQYINSMAAAFLLKLSQWPTMPDSFSKNNINDNLVTSHYTYETKLTNDALIPAKKFKIDGITYYRTGRKAKDD